MANEVAERKEQTFSMVLTDGLMENKEALPQDFNIARFVQNSVALLNGNEVLTKYAKQYGVTPIKQGLLRGAYLGVDALNSEFHLVPYGDKLQFLLDYRGAVKLMKKYSIKPIDDIFADVVRAGDDYERWSENGNQYYKFKPIPFNAGAVTGAFAVIKFSDDTMMIEEMSLSELEKVRSKSKMGNGMAWKDFTTEMYKKTVLHRMKKRISLDFDSPQQKELFDEDGAIELGKPQCEVPDIEEPQEIIQECTVVEEVQTEEEFDIPDFMK